MLKALLKKQLWEMLSLSRRGQKNKKTSGGKKLLYGLVAIYVLGVLGVSFFSIMQMLCLPLVQADQTWLYFALAGILATFLGLVGNIFMAQTQLYNAKDNDLLLAMPIPPWKILFCRMLGLYLQVFVFEALVLVPAYLVYWTQVQASAMSIILCACILFVLPLLCLFFSCIFGWVIAKISSRMRRKNLITLVLVLAFFLAYYYIYTQFNHYLQLILLNSGEIGETLKIAVYPLYQMGLAAQGNIGSFFLFALCIFVLFGLVYLLLSHGFLRIATMKSGASKVRYREKKLKVRSVDRTLLKKEWMHLGNSPMYLLNCGLGTILLLIGVVAAVIKKSQLIGVAMMLPGMEALLPLMACAAICLLTTMNLFTAPSISLEAKTLWLLQSLPMPGWKVLKSKLMLHIWITLPPALLCMVVLNVILDSGWVMGLLSLILCGFFVLYSAALGLVINLKLPKLNWKNEIAAVKQSGSTIAAIFAGWGTMIVLIVLGAMLCTILPQSALAIFYIVLLFGISALLLRWLKKRGVEILQTL